MVEQLLKAYKQDDLQNFNNSKWKVIQAVSDFESHRPQIRKTKEISNTGTPGFQVVMNGMPLLNQVYRMLQEAV